MKLSVTIVVLLAVGGFVACSGSSAPTTNPIGTGTGSGSGSSSGGGGDDSGSTSGDDGGSSSGGEGGSCTVAADWAQNSNGPACDTCEQKNCCAVIKSCSNDTGCTAIFDCQNNCYSGVGPDGGSVAGDGGIVDDAGDTSEDVCAQACVTQQPQASQDLFTAQDDCVNGTGANQCGASAVCN
jgi:hypothetical protein